MFLYKTYDQPTLDNQYNNRARVPNFEQIVQQWEQASEALRQRAQFYDMSHEMVGARQVGETIALLQKTVRPASPLL